MSAPLVSVVIPCFNQGQFLGDALHSVQAQNYPAIETIVVNDGSSDDTSAIASAHGARLIVQLNQGVSAARNTGLRAAHGEFVVFLDADDELLPDAVASGVAALRQNLAASCVVRRCEAMDTDRRPLPTRYVEVDPKKLYPQLLQQNFAWTPGAAVFRRERLAELGGFPTEFSPAADYAVYLMLARRREVEFRATPAVKYRQHTRNMSLDPALMLRATLEVLLRERKHVPREFMAEYRRGLHRWREYYGDQIVERLRRERRAGASSAWQRHAVWTLLTCCPTIVAKHGWRKMSRLLRGFAPGPVEPDRFQRDGVPPESPP
ncbi:MAG TPA: glycosyltransferase [Vicinamibacterales bacterium]|nr:glycosyltransferase [Vicinamibacterales bacterium]